MAEKKNVWNNCVSWDSRPKTMPEGLNILADWFDAVYEDQGKNDQVQQDLRRWADDVINIESELARLRKDYADSCSESDSMLSDIKQLRTERDEQAKDIARLRDVFKVIKEKIEYDIENEQAELGDILVGVNEALKVP